MLFIKVLCCKQAAIIPKLKLKLFNLLNHMQKKKKKKTMQSLVYMGGQE